MAIYDPDDPVQSVAGTDAFNQRLTDIQSSYIDNLPDKLEQIDRLWNKLRFFNWTDDNLKTLFTMVHTLAGNGKTFGFEKLSECARSVAEQINSYIKSNDIPNTSQQNEISSLIQQLIQSVNKKSTSSSQQTSAEIKASTSLIRNAHCIYIVDDDEHTTDFLSAQLESSGYQVESFYNVNDVLQRIKENSPSALVMDIMFPGDSNMQGILAAEQIHSIAGKHIPTIFISARGDITARLGALRAKGNAYFNKPVDPEKLIHKLDDLIISKTSVGRIAIIDDDELVSERNALILRKYHYETLVVNKPLHALEEIQKFKPDLILLDIHMPDINGLELAQIIKQDETYLTTPILFLSADKTEAVRQASMSISGDEYLTKDITQNELLRKIHNRLINASLVKSQIKEISKKDLTTGLVNRKYFFNLLEKSISEASEHSDLYLLQINVDHFEYIAKQVSVIYFDDFIKHIVNTVTHFLNTADIACHLTDQSIAILCSEDLETVSAIAEDIIKATEEKPYRQDDAHIEFTVSVGITPINQDSTTVSQVLTQVEQATAQAQSQGGCQAHHYSIEALDDSSSSVVSPDLVSRIYHAVDQRRFKLVFQPIIGMGDKNDEYYEVLVRLVDEKDKLYLPSQFFPVIKQNDLVHEVDRWVLENTLDVYARDAKMKVRGNFFVKLSGESLSRGAFSIWVNNCINSIGLIGANRITFEIPEADILTRERDTHKFITHLPRPTCQFAIDHFGSTEYSLQLLEEFKVDYVKLSGALISQIQADPQVRKKVQQLVEKAQQADVAVIAGSLEDPKTLTMLWSWGVRYFQGYFIHSPNAELNYDFSSNDYSLG